MKQLDLTLIYPVKDGKVLLAMKKRGFGTGKYNGAGGKVEANETIEQAMVREASEEIGITPIKYEKVGYLVFNEHHLGVRKIMNIHIFKTTKWSGEIMESEEMKPEWFDASKLPLNKMWQADSIWLPLVLKGKKLIGNFTLNEDETVKNYKIKEVDLVPQKTINKFAVFDIDGTLIRWQLYHAVVDKLASTGLLGDRAKDKLKAARLKWKNRTHPEAFREYENFLIDLYESSLTNIDSNVFDNLVHEVVSEYKDQVYTYTRDLIKYLNENGYLLFAISGSHQELVSLIADHYGFDDAIGTYYERQDNLFSGKKFIASHNKKEILENLIKEYGLDINDSFAVGDSLSDAAMLEMVSNPIAFNPDKSLLERAKKNKWKIVVERKNVIYELEPKDGSYILA